VSHHLVEQAVVGVAGLDGGAGGAALHEGGVVVEDESAALLVLVVAVDALVLEDGKDMLVVGGAWRSLLRLRDGGRRQQGEKEQEHQRTHGGIPSCRFGGKVQEGSA
jgi:hypothetical protein